MTTPKLLVETDARGVCTMAFNRPDKGNAYDAEMLHAMADTLQRIDRDAAVRLLVLRAYGKHFSVGADLSAAPASVTGRTVGLIDVCLALDQLSKPSIALVQGGCIGGGVAFVSCCDMVVAEPTSFFSIPEVRIGFAPGPLTPFFLRAMGLRAVRRYALSGERFDASRAQALGLVHEVTADCQSAEAAAPWTAAFLAGAPGAQAELKRTLAQVEHTSVDLPLLQSLQARFDVARASDEALEGKAAFREKRPPRWNP